MADSSQKPSLASARRRSLIASLRTNFLTGLIVVAPVGITIYLAWTLITLVDAAVVPLLPEVYNPRTWVEYDIPGFGLFIFLVFTTIVGYFTKNLFGRQIIRIGEGWLDNIPIIRSIYNALKQIVETILSQSNASFQNACLVEYPRKGIWAVAFVSTQTRGEIIQKVGPGSMTSVFLPTTPNPTSGFLLFVPTEDVVLLDMSVEEAAKLVISAGLVTPPTKEELEAAQRRAQARKAALASASKPNGNSKR